MPLSAIAQWCPGPSIAFPKYLQSSNASMKSAIGQALKSRSGGQMVVLSECYGSARLSQGAENQPMATAQCINHLGRLGNGSKWQAVRCCAYDFLYSSSMLPFQDHFLFIDIVTVTRNLDLTTVASHLLHLNQSVRVRQLPSSSIPLTCILYHLVKPKLHRRKYR